MPATNFEEFVALIAEEAPHAVVLDWYRRLELMLRDYLASGGFRYIDGRHAENVAKADSLLGEEVATSIGQLRALRNRVAHTSQPLTPAEAIDFARRSLTLIGQLWGARDVSVN
jgi:hypothetical protein